MKEKIKELRELFREKVINDELDIESIAVDNDWIDIEYKIEENYSIRLSFNKRTNTHLSYTSIFNVEFSEEEVKSTIEKLINNHRDLFIDNTKQKIQNLQDQITKLEEQLWKE